MRLEESTEPIDTFYSMIDQICCSGVHLAAQHRLAVSLDRDGFKSEAIKSFASCGNFGRSPQNVERDIHAWLGNIYGIGLRPRTIDVDVAINESGEIGSRAIHVLAPHDLLQAAYRKGPLVWQTSFLHDASQHGISECWENFMQQPYGSNHPIAEHTQTLDSTVPLVCHIDGAESFRNVEAIIWSLSSVFASGGVFDSRFPLCVLPVTLLPTPALQKGAHAAVAQFLSWSFDLCMQGRTETGENLAGKWRGAFVFWKGDRKMRKECHLFSRYWQTTQMCELCLANLGYKRSVPELTCGDLSDRARWWDTETSDRAYLLTEPRLSPWTVVPGWSLHQNAEDLMHDYHEGIGRDLCAALIVVALEECRLGEGSPDECLGRLYTEAKAWCITSGIKCPARGFTLAAIGHTTSNTFPFMGARFKAAHIKVYTVFLADFMYRTCTGERVSKLLSVCAWGAAEFLHCLDCEGLVMTAEAVARAGHASQVFLTSYQALAGHYFRQGKARFKVRPKCHYFCHLRKALMRNNLDPRKLSCFLDEDYVGKLAQLTRNCSRVTCSQRVLQRYILFLATRWQRRARAGTFAMRR